jgi:NAD(P)-dependent dehydrogenase (short-subunit alcohol dehydrogenase family)
MENSRAVFITGATGIARASAIELARRGFDIAIMSRTQEDVDETASLVESEGRRALALTGDVSSEPDMVSAYETIHQVWGGLSGIFANAGINGKWAPIERLSLDDWKKTIDINLTGTFLTVKHGVPHLKHSGGGSIVITSSVNGTRMFSNTGASAYASTKAAQVAFAQMMALELAPDHIRVNVICPGMIETEIEESTDKDGFEEAQYPVEYPAGKLPLTHGKPGSSEDVARLVAFLISDESSLITGTPIWIDGAQSLLMG